VAKRVPEAGWLVQKIPAPPLVRMLIQYLPTLVGREPAVPKVVLDQLRKGITVRDQVAHEGARAVESETLKGTLTAVRDLLWLLDYYGGQTWALAHLSSATRDAFGAPRS